HCVQVLPTPRRKGPQQMLTTDTLDPATKAAQETCGNTSINPGPNPRIGGAMEQSSRPRPAADIIGPDPAAWLARVTGLPYAYVATKLAEARAHLDGEVPA